MIVLGIDPGATSGLAWVREETLRLPEVFLARQCPLVEALDLVATVAKPDVVVVERGYVGGNKQAAMTFGETTGRLLQAAYATNPEAILYRAEPNVWRSTVGAPTRDGDAAKRWCVEWAQKHCPTLVSGPKSGVLVDAAEAIQMALAGCEWRREGRRGWSWEGKFALAKSVGKKSR